MAIRAQPVKSVFARMPRIVRDLAAILGKEVRIVTTGEMTEIDKTVIEQLNDPLTHMIRNALDHGIELPDVRAACGKSRQGTIHLAAAQQSGRIVIEVSDDGRGIDRERVLAKAQDRGLVAPGAVISDEEIDNLISSRPSPRPTKSPTSPAAASAWTSSSETSSRSAGASPCSRAGVRVALHPVPAADPRRARRHGRFGRHGNLHHSADLDHRKPAPAPVRHPPRRRARRRPGAPRRIRAADLCAPTLLDRQRHRRSLPRHRRSSSRATAPGGSASSSTNFSASSRSW